MERAVRVLNGFDQGDERMNDKLRLVPRPDDMPTAPYRIPETQPDPVEVSRAQRAYGVTVEDDAEAASRREQRKRDSKKSR